MQNSQNLNISPLENKQYLLLCLMNMDVHICSIPCDGGRFLKKNILLISDGATINYMDAPKKEILTQDAQNFPFVS